MKFKYNDQDPVTLIGNVVEIVFFFDKKPKLLIKYIPSPYEAIVDKYFSDFYQTNILDKMGEKTFNMPNDYFKKALSTVRYIDYVKPHSSIGNMIPYGAYFSNAVHVLHTTAKLQYVYAVMCSVASALIREKFHNHEHIKSLKWDDLVKSLELLIRKKTGEYSLFSDIQSVSEIVSFLYAEIVSSTDVKLQLKALYTADCSLDENKLSSKDFGHLLAAFLFVNSPLHVISKLEARNERSTEKVYYTEKQKLFVYKISTNNDPVPYDHGICWTFNVVIGSRREYFFDLEDKMIPGARMLRVNEARKTKAPLVSSSKQPAQSVFVKNHKKRYYLAMEAAVDGGEDNDHIPASSQGNDPVNTDLSNSGDSAAGSASEISVETDPVPENKDTVKDQEPNSYWTSNYDCTKEDTGKCSEDKIFKNLISVKQNNTTEVRFRLYVPYGMDLEGYTSPKTKETEGF